MLPKSEVDTIFTVAFSEGVGVQGRGRLAAMSTPQDRTRPHRRLPVLVTELAIGDGEAALPVVGEIGRYWLLFAETSPDERDPSIVTVEVDVEPLDDGVPLRQPALSAALLEDERWWEWRLFVRGDGWSATWYSRRPAVGRQRLTGRLLGDLGYATTGSARGRVRRARVVADNYRLLEQPATGPRHHPRWIPVLGTRTLRDVDAATGVFRDDTRPALHRAEGEDVVRECGVLVDLDLDDVPALPVRPNIVPAAVSAHGRDAWVVDRELPVVIRMSDKQRIVEYRLPGRIFASPRIVHAGSMRTLPDAGWSAGTGSSAVASTVPASGSTTDLWAGPLPVTVFCSPGTGPVSTPR